MAFSSTRTLPSNARWILAAMLAGLTAGGCVWADDVTPQRVAQVEDERIDEASGIVASRANPGLYYVINDSGDTPRVFVIDRQGRTIVIVRLSGAEHVDYEDIALAPGDADGPMDVCVADIGDNLAKRDDLVIYRFPEIDPNDALDGEIVVEPRAYRVAYADRPTDAEAFFVHPATGDGWIVSKGETFGVYQLRAPWRTDKVNIMPRRAQGQLPGAFELARLVTAADIRGDGKRLVVRTYAAAWEWDVDAAGNIRAAFDHKPESIPVAVEPQGEAICYAADGRSILTISEKVPTFLYEVAVEPVADAAEKPAAGPQPAPDTSAPVAGD